MFTGHPKGLFRLFFIEMWERLAFYTMVGILLLYATDTESGGLGWSKAAGNEVYGLYLAFVYFTPYLGGLIADRFLGYRKSVLFGGLLFASGFFLLSSGMFLESKLSWSFPVGLILLCCGNGLFKPNISAMVGNLYDRGDPKRDAGFNIFYMGINIGAFVGVVPLLGGPQLRTGGCGRSSSGGGGGPAAWAWSSCCSSWREAREGRRRSSRQISEDDAGFGEIVALKILGACARASARSGSGRSPTTWMTERSATKLVRWTDFGFLFGMIPVLYLLRRGCGTDRQGRPRSQACWRCCPSTSPGGTFFMVLHLNGSAMTVWANDNTARHTGQPDPIVAIANAVNVDGKPVFAGPAYPGYYDNAANDVPRPQKVTLLNIATLEQTRMFGQKRMDEANLTALTEKLPADVKIETLPMKGELTDQQEAWKKLSVDIYDKVEVKEETDSHGLPVISVDVGDSKPSQRIVFVRTVGDATFPTYLVTPEKFDGLYAGDPPTVEEPGEYLRTANAELYQSWNAFFVVIFTPLVVAFFATLMRKKVDFSTAKKVFAGMVITAISALFMALAGFLSNNGEVKVSGMWLMGFYAIVTVGELFLSPMALSLVTKLSPKRFVGLTMGGWFFATAVGNKFSGFLGVLQGEMSPAMFFLIIAIAVGLVAGYIKLVLPKLDAAIKQYGA